MQILFKFLEFISILLLLFRTCNSYKLNATGGTFPNAIYQDSTFSYQFAQSLDAVSYFATGSGGGKCNVMGYWTTSNTNPNAVAPAKSILTSDGNICTDKCSLTTNNCVGFTGTQRWDKDSRTPLIDFGASDSLFSSADYTVFPDLQMLPAVAGAVVPIYNIPELTTSSDSITLSRSVISNIFLGNIRYWNDPSILALQTPALKATLSGISSPIKVVVRGDSSGTSEIFTTALSLFSPASTASPFPTNDFSFANTVGKGERPSWCGPKTDEIQTITTTSCDSSLPLSQRTLLMKAVTKTFAVANITFACDDSAAAVKAAFEAVYGPNTMIVYRNKLSDTSYAFTIGYWITTTSTKAPGLSPQNMYEPMVTSSAAVGVSVSTKQEGGFWNSHYNNSAYFAMSEIQSLFLNPAVPTVFTLSNPNNASAPSLQTAPLTVSSGDMSTAIFNAIAAISPALLVSVKKVTHSASSGWDEYQLTFSGTKKMKALVVHAKAPYASLAGASVILASLQRGSNYPFFYDSLNAQGFSSSGRYTCYRHDHNLTEWSYFTGWGTLGVVAEVTSLSYSIGYAVLTEGQQYNLKMANMINLAGNIITPNGTSVTYAVMEKGGNLDSRLNAVISDGQAAKVWPIAGYTYFAIRANKHPGTCDQRKRAMQFLYWYYNSDAVVQQASALGYSTLPSFIRDIVLEKLMSVAKCNNGEYAFTRSSALPIRVSSLIASPMSTYISAFYNLDSTSKWNMSSDENSLRIWSDFLSDARTTVGAVTVLSSKKLKQLYYRQGTPSNIITTAYAHVAVIPIYNLQMFSKASTSLRVTPEILAKIYAGKITYWDDILIKTANSANAKYLPHQPIVVVYRSTPCDVNAIFTRYLAMKSAHFNATYAVPEDGLHALNATSVIPSSRLWMAVDNAHVDSYVTFTDGSIGYYAQIGSPNALVASFCLDSVCSNVIAPNNPTTLANCESDANTLVKLDNGVSYDLLVSTASNCYPLAATVDYSLQTSLSDSECSAGSYGIASRKVYFSSWLYNGTALTVPLTNLNIQGSPTIQRTQTFNKICDITCGGKELGYTYCGYRDCEWDSKKNGGDYIQLVSSCDKKTGKRAVSYVLTEGNTCIQRESDPMRGVNYIDCDYLPRTSPVGLACYSILSFGALLTVYVIYKTFLHRKNKSIKKSQPAFLSVFMLGALLLHVVILPVIGPNTTPNCLSKVWLFDISMTIMYGPLVMKLVTVEKLVYANKLKKTSVTIVSVLMEVAVLVLIDVIILSIWMSVWPPVQTIKYKNYDSVLAPVADHVCDTSPTNPFVIAMVCWKCILLGFGILKAVCTWNVLSAVSESKQFGVALAIGILTYLISIFMQVDAESQVLLQCLCNFFCSVLAVFLIMLPKLAAKGKILMYRKESNASMDSHNSRGSVSPGKNVEINDAAAEVAKIERERESNILRKSVILLQKFSRESLRVSEGSISARPGSISSPGSRPGSRLGSNHRLPGSPKKDKKIKIPKAMNAP